MSFTNAVAVLEQLKAYGTTRKPKELLLQASVGNVVLKSIFVHTYDWMRTYGVIVNDLEDKQPPQGQVRDETWPAFAALLGKLSGRELTGGAARAAWEAFTSTCSPKEVFWLTKVLNRDLKIGIAESTVAKIWPDALSPFDCQLATDMTKHKLGRVKKGETPKPLYTFPMWVEPKLDGLRVLIIVDGSKATVHSRTGKELPGLQHFADAIATTVPGEYVVDGEIFHDKWNSTVTLAKTYPENLTEEELVQLKELTYYAFDWLPLEHFRKGFCPIPLEQRRGVLEGLVGKLKASRPERIVTTDVFKVMSLEEINPLYQGLLEQGIEGCMIKYPNSPYQFGRGSNWLKLKPWRTEDSVIIGFEQGKKGSKHEEVLGAFIVQMDNGSTVKVGGSLSDKQRKEFWDRRDELLGKMIEFKMTDDKAADVVARFPNFVRFRPDRDK